ncbi:apolipoprotein N-acyltransferase [Candidatus Sumerlaeota bacterium]|nr:apolipoprotein N-acyltransferase [Candidatus Sumerlaeota bacterium]
MDEGLEDAQIKSTRRKKSNRREAAPAKSEPAGNPDGSWLPALLGGIAGGLSFEPFGLRFLIPLAPLGLFLAARRAATNRKAFVRVLAGGFIFYMTAISWLCTLFHYNLFAPLGIPVVALYMALFPALAALALRRWFGALCDLPAFAVWSALWLLSEWFRTLGRLAMPFTQIGHAWAVCPWAIQWADCFGESAVNMEVMLVGGVILGVAQRAYGRGTDERGQIIGGKRAAMGWVVLLGFITLVVFGGSALRLRAWDRKLAEVSADQKLRVLAIQPNIDQFTKMASYMDDNIEMRARLQEAGNQIHENLVVENITPETDLVVMPESTYAELEFAIDERLHQRIERLMAGYNADALFGADRLILTPQQEIGEVYNSAWFLPHGKTMREAGWQDKMRLVPFGEHLPYFNMIPVLKTLVGIAEFNEGQEVHIFNTHGHKFGAMICFESTFGNQARKIAKEGAEFLTIITNDAWYRWSAGDGPHWSVGPAQHHNLALLRAVETRRPVIRAANTGISSIILPNGRIDATLGLGRRGALKGDIAPQNARTIYVRWGNFWMVIGCVIILAVATRSGKRAELPMQMRG